MEKSYFYTSHQVYNLIVANDALESVASHLAQLPPHWFFAIGFRLVLPHVHDQLFLLIAFVHDDQFEHHAGLQ